MANSAFPLGGGQYSTARPHFSVPRLLAEILQRDLDALIVHFLEFGLERVAALCAAREELGDMGDRRAVLPLKRLDLRRRAHIDEAVEIVIDHVVEQGVDVDAACRLVADEQHLRAILGLPLGNTNLILPSAMVNLLGEPGFEGLAQYVGIDEIMQLPGVHIHLYGKRLTKPFRKMGHVTIVDEDIKQLKKKANFVKQTLKVTA